MLQVHLLSQSFNFQQLALQLLILLLDALFCRVDYVLGVLKLEFELLNNCLEIVNLEIEDFFLFTADLLLG